MSHNHSMSTTTLTIANQKGGVGKTTTAINLGAALAEQGIRTLIIDLDPQGNATSGLGKEKVEGGSIYGPLSGDGLAEDLVVDTTVPDLYLIPSEVDLAAAEIELSQGEDYLIQLRRCLALLQDSGTFRTVILDCPPALGLLSMNSLAAADYLLIALQSEYLAMEGLGQILEIVEQLRTAGVNERLQLGGILMTMVDVRTNLCRQVVSEVRKHFGNLVFESVIPRTIRLGEAPSFGQAIFQYDPLSPATSAYRALGKEVMERFDLIQ